MKLKDLKAFFIHVGNRERSHGIPDAFRFKKVLSSRKKGTIYDARYREADLDSDHTPVPTPTPISHRSSSSNNQLSFLFGNETSTTRFHTNISGEPEQRGDEDTDTAPPPSDMTPALSDTTPAPSDIDTQPDIEAPPLLSDSDMPRAHEDNSAQGPAPSLVQGTRKSTRQQVKKMANTNQGLVVTGADTKRRSTRSKGKGKG